MARPAPTVAIRSEDARVSAVGFHLWAGQAHALAQPLPTADLVVRFATEAREALEIGIRETSPRRMDHRYLLENRQRWWRRLPKITSRCTSIDHGSPSTSMAGLIVHLDLDRR
jgi:hypothetical protein